jgi:cholesterol transport system auxiliary component
MKKYFLMTLLGLTGCSIIPNPGEPPKRFTLEPLSPMVGKPTSEHKLMIDLPNVYPPLDNQRIGVVPEANRIDYYADCEWGDRLDVLVQDSLIYSLQNRMIFSGVTRANDGVMPDLLLKTDVRKFFVVQTPKPVAVVQYFAQLIRLTDRQVISQQAFETKLPLNSEELSEISVKLNQANLDVVHKIVNWLSSTSF